MTHRLSRGAIACALLATTAIVSPALAQEPLYRNFDSNGVDLVQGDLELPFTDGSIGTGQAELSIERKNASSAFSQWDRISFHQTVSGGVYTTTIGLPDGSFEKFVGSTNVKANGGTLSGYLYTAPDGTTISFTNPSNDPTEYGNNFCGSGGGWPCDLVPDTITYSDGRKIRFTFGVRGPGPLVTGRREYYWRLQSITNSFGYGIAFTYQTPLGTYPPAAGWFTRTTAKLQRDGVTQSTISYAYPGGGAIDVTDAAGNVWRITNTSIRRPGEATPFFSANSATAVTSVTSNGVTTSYNRVVAGSTATMTVTNPLSQTNVIVSDLNIGRPISFKDGLNRTTSFQYDTSGRLNRVTQPEGNYTQYGYDSRGNVTTTTNVAKSGSGLANIVTSADFDSTCANPVKCNKPNTTTDAKGNVTNYTYDPTHGGVTSIKLAAPSAGADRPETRLSYSLVTSQSGDIVAMLTGSSTCASAVAPACVGTASESKASLVYDAHGNATSSSRSDGSGALVAASTMTYDERGNLLTVDGPLAGAADTTRFRYDLADRLVGVTSPDPDDAGGLKNRAVRVTYRPDGQVSKRELGSVNSQSDADWTAFNQSQVVDIGFDSNARPVTSKLSRAGVDYTLAQTSYDALGRPDCAAMRMNIAAYGSLPASACALGTEGSFGPDRISQSVYDAAGQITQMKVAVGTADAATERTLTYSSNGQLATLKDAENNLTTYEYDGFDRLSKTRFPVATKGASSSSTTDYEQLTYDSNSNVASRRLRDGGSMGFTYDNLNRVTVKSPPNPDPTVTFGYDNLGRLTSAAKTAIGISLSFTYDALGRKLTEAGPEGVAAIEYDLAGRRTKLTYPGSGLFVNYDHMVTGEVTRIRENGATSGVGVLATYAYDPASSAGQFGLATSVTFGNGAVQGFSYDPVLRLAALTNDLSGTASDLTVTVGGYNPASQMIGTTRSNDAYAFTGNANGSIATTTNGLNQAVSIGGSAATWDSKGNLASDPTSGKSYTYYPSTNQLWTVSSPFTAMSYDPLDRLAVIDSTTDAKFAYDGANAIAEHDGSDVLQRRFVFGPGIDNPIVQYEGSGTTDRRFLSKDERGSVISATDSSGALLNVDSYDEYGRPGASNSGRFQYTGQKWIGEAGVYDYKARAYLPHLGIFAQTDPAGYQDSPNLYAYALADPLNLSDPAGLGALGPGCVTIYRIVRMYIDKNHDGKLGPGDEVVSRETTPIGQICPGVGSTSGGVAHDIGGGSGSAAAAQQQVCAAPPFSGLLSNSRVQSQIRNATQQAQNTPNAGLGPDVPANGSETAFNALNFGIFGTYVGGTYTGAAGVPREHMVDYQPSPISPSRFFVTMVHVHQSPFALPGLSPADIALTGTANGNPGVNVVAVQPNGGTFCAAAH